MRMHKPKMYKGTLSQEYFDALITKTRFSSDAIKTLQAFFVDGKRPMEINRDKRQLLNARIKQMIVHIRRSKGEDV